MSSLNSEIPQRKNFDALAWDDVLYWDKNYTIVRKDIDTYNSYVVQVGVQDKKGNWIQPISEGFIFAKAINEIGKDRVASTNVAYLGEGVFILCREGHVNEASGVDKNLGYDPERGELWLSFDPQTCYFYNVITGVETTFTMHNISYCSNGYMLMYPSDRYNPNFCSVTADGIASEIPVEYDSWYDGPHRSGYSDGVFFANGYFYDINGEMVLDLTQYNLTSTPYFIDGRCNIRFKNEGGTEYRATIDKAGNFINEPSKIA